MGGSTQSLKQKAGRAAVEFVQSGMKESIIEQLLITKCPAVLAMSMVKPDELE